VDGIHLRLCIKAGALPRIFLPFINERKATYGIESNNESAAPATEASQKKVAVEFSSPNIASDFQAKHLRSTIIGAFVSNMYELMGWEVAKVNYLGDWGKDIALLGVGWEKFGSEEEFEKDPVSHLLDVYHKIHDLFLPEQNASRKARDEAKKNNLDELEATAEIEGKGIFAERNAFFKRLEDGDEQAVALFKRIRDININNYTKFYSRLGVRFDEYSGESQVSHDVIAEVEQALKDKGISEESGGAWVIDMRQHGARSGTAIVRDRTGSSTYFLRYLASVLERSRKENFDKIIFVAADRTGHFSRLFKVFEALGMSDLAGKLEHIQLNDVSHMAEKLGPGYQPHEILDRCESSMRDVLTNNEAKSKVIGNSEEVAKALGITALIAQEVSTKRISDHAFDISSMTTFKTGTGPDLQYQYARLCSLLKDHPFNADITDEEYGTLTEEVHTGLLLTLGQYPEILHATQKSMEPLGIMTYLHTVIDRLSDCLDEDEEDPGAEVEEGIPGPSGGMQSHETEEKTVTPAQSALYEATRIVLENGMKLLGLTPIANLHLDRADTPIASP
jgi:arginyl-tRNA synthetase